MYKVIIDKAQTVLSNIVLRLFFSNEKGNCHINKELFEKNLFHRELVSKDGIIDPSLFYLGLTIWYAQDSLGLWESEVEIHPQPPSDAFRSDCHIFPRKNINI